MTGITLRLINFLLDTFIYLIIVVLFLFIFRNIIDRENAKLMSIVLYFLYYFLFEYFTGQTPGKMITKSKVVTLTRDKHYFLFQIFGRTLMRFIPIDIISYLFSTNGLHDMISKTTVTKL
jgi:uncharacterized RDD family membrane protein YckC